MAKKRATKTSKLAGGKTLETMAHDAASRLNIPTAENFLDKVLQLD